jgi:hypothetical protein
MHACHEQHAGIFAGKGFARGGLGGMKAAHCVRDGRNQRTRRPVNAPKSVSSSASQGLSTKKDYDFVVQTP